MLPSLIDQTLTLVAAVAPRMRPVDDREVPQIKDAEILTLMEHQNATDFAPGSRWRYSNTGYAMLAMIVEGISGKPFGEFLRERIFEPLKMTGTLAYQVGKNEVPHRALGYTNKSGAWIAYGAERLGNGREAARQHLIEHQELLREIRKRQVVGLGWPGSAPTQARTYPAFRLYARGLADVEPLRQYFSRQGLAVATQAAAIQQVQTL